MANQPRDKYEVRVAHDKELKYCEGFPQHLNGKVCVDQLILKVDDLRSMYHNRLFYFSFEVAFSSYYRLDGKTDGTVMELYSNKLIQLPKEDIEARTSLQSDACIVIEPTKPQLKAPYQPLL